MCEKVTLMVEKREARARRDGGGGGDIDKEAGLVTASQRG